MAVQQVDLVPDGSPAVTTAVARALAVVAADAKRSTFAYGSAWRRAALGEAVDRDPGYVPSPRSKRGAARA